MNQHAGKPLFAEDERDFPDGRFTVRDRDGSALTLPGVAGMSLMEILRAAGLDVAATCGGAAVCGTCHVYVAPGDAARLPGAGAAEIDQLDQLRHADASSRLACQIVWRPALDGLSVVLAAKE